MTNDELLGALFDDQPNYQIFLALGFDECKAALLAMGVNGV
jgi:hypothetical protein